MLQVPGIKSCGNNKDLDDCDSNRDPDQLLTTVRNGVRIGHRDGFPSLDLLSAKMRAPDCSRKSVVGVLHNSCKDLFSFFSSPLPPPNIVSGKFWVLTI